MIGIDTAVSKPKPSGLQTSVGLKPGDLATLRRGDILLQTRSHTLFGGAVTAQMYLPMTRSQAWSQLTDYPRWVQFFPDIIRSEILDCHRSRSRTGYRLYQVARKEFLMITAQVEIYLHVVEKGQQQIQFRLERGSFTDFSADLTLQDDGQGTILTYSVQATPIIPVPSILIQEAIRQDLPGNMKQMRQALSTPILNAA